jgi:hypothetical protein
VDQLSFLPETLVKAIQQEKGSSDANSQATRCSSSTLEMLRLLASLDVPKDLLACMLELCEFSIHHIRYLAGPLVLHRSSWAETTPAWLKIACVQDRFDLILNEYERNEVGIYATPAEVLAYMMPASMDAPMYRNYVELYFWAGNEVMTKYNRLPKDANSLYEAIGERLIQFNDVKIDFHDLGRSIRQSVVKHAAQQGWGKRRRRDSSEAIANSPIQRPAQPEQESLF